MFTAVARLFILGDMKIDWAEIMLPCMRKIRARFHETVGLAVLEEPSAVGIIVAAVQETGRFGFTLCTGHRFPIHTGAPAKAMLAFLPDEERERMLNSIEYKRFNSRTIKNKKELLKALETARVKGFALDLAERIEGLHGVASPIMNYLNYPVAAIWVTGPSYRMSEPELERLGPIVKKYAGKISQRLGYES